MTGIRQVRAFHRMATIRGNGLQLHHLPWTWPSKFISRGGRASFACRLDATTLPFCLPRSGRVEAVSREPARPGGESQACLSSAELFKAHGTPPRFRAPSSTYRIPHELLTHCGAASALLGGRRTLHVHFCVGCRNAGSAMRPCGRRAQPSGRRPDSSDFLFLATNLNCRAIRSQLPS